MENVLIIERKNKICNMKKVNDLLLIAAIVFATTFLACLIIKLFINNEASLFVLSYYLIGLTLPIIQLFFEKNITRKKLVISSSYFPFMMTFVTYWLDFLL